MKSKLEEIEHLNEKIQRIKSEVLEPLLLRKAKLKREIRNTGWATQEQLASERKAARLAEKLHYAKPFRDLRTTGASYREIGVSLGVSAAAAHYWCRFYEHWHEYKEPQPREPFNPHPLSGDSEIGQMDLSVRGWNAVSNVLKLQTVGDLLRYSEDDLFAIKHVGSRTIAEIKEELRRNGMSLATSRATESL